jgi:F-type H+-transporting ATPase subunit delta
MQSSAAARRYARALFSLAGEEGRVEEVRSELNALEKLFAESSELQHAVFRPLHPVAERRSVLRELTARVGASRTVSNFFGYLVDRRRLIDFDSICGEYGRLADAAAGRVRAKVVSAVGLRDDQRERLRRALAGRTGKQVELEEGVDASLLGGAVATVGGVVFDGSLRTQLAQLHGNLTKQH